MTDLLDAALGYARRGWHVFPIFEPITSGCSCSRRVCGDIGKHPRTDHGLKEATTDQAQIRAWWDKWPAANVGIRTGATSGLFVVDVDAGKNGAESLAALETEHGSLPDTLTVGTSGGGFHLYFEHPGQKVPNHNTGKRLGPGVDVRGDGGYVVAPPSLHRSGERYSVLRDFPIGKAPSWVVDRVRERDPVTESTESAESTESIERQSVDSVTSQSSILDVAGDCVVKAFGEHEPMTMLLARRLKFECGVTGPSDPRALQAFRVWWPPSKPNCRNQDEGFALDKFLRAIDTARVPLDGTGMIHRAWLALAEGPYGDGLDDLPGDALIGRLAATIRDISRRYPGMPVACSCHQFKLLPMRVHRMLSTLERMRIVKCVKRGQAGFAGSGASRFLWIGTEHLRGP